MTANAFFRNSRRLSGGAIGRHPVPCGFSVTSRKRVHYQFHLGRCAFARHAIDKQVQTTVAVVIFAREFTNGLAAYYGKCPQSDLDFDFLFHADPFPTQTPNNETKRNWTVSTNGAAKRPSQIIVNLLPRCIRKAELEVSR